MYPQAYIHYLVHFHGDRDYFECHELLEEHWKNSKQDKHSLWVGLILLAVSNYHHRRENKAGAARTLAKAIDIFIQKHEQLMEHAGIDSDELLHMLKQREVDIQNNLPYTSLNLPIADPDLIKRCQRICLKKGIVWGQESNPLRVDLINRHSQRDRSEVTEEREKALDFKKRKGRE